MTFKELSSSLGFSIANLFLQSGFSSSLPRALPTPNRQKSCSPTWPLVLSTHPYSICFGPFWNWQPGPTRSSAFVPITHTSYLILFANCPVLSSQTMFLLTRRVHMHFCLSKWATLDQPGIAHHVTPKSPQSKGEQFSDIIHAGEQCPLGSQPWRALYYRPPLCIAPCPTSPRRCLKL